MTPCIAPPISPLSLNQLTRDYWGSFDASAIAQLAPLGKDDCYAPKFYKAPADFQEVVPAYGYVPYGMRITPGSVIFGLYLPCAPVPDDLTGSEPSALFTLQVTDDSLQHKWFDDPVSSALLGNYKPTFQSNFTAGVGSFPNLLTAPYPVVGNGLFLVEIQNQTNAQKRIEVIFGVLEVCG